MTTSARIVLATAVGITALTSTFATAAYPRGASDAQVRRLVIQQAIATSSSACPCPYSKTRKGKLCGPHSLYGQRGGVPMQCYPRDVSDQDVDAYRNEHGLDRR